MSHCGLLVGQLFFFLPHLQARQQRSGAQSLQASFPNAAFEGFGAKDRWAGAIASVNSVY